MDARSIVIGIDVAAARPCTAVAVRTGRAAQAVEWMEADARDADSVKGLLAWIERHGPAVVAIDAPQDYKGPKRRASGSRPQADPSSRLCERELLARRISLYQVPSRVAIDEGRTRLAPWIAAGFDLFRRLRRLGFEAPEDAVLPGAFGGAPVLLEVYPYATFATMLGGLPPRKLTRAGQHMRVMTLRRAGVEWDEYFDHDSLDALAAALTAWRFLQGRATPVGDPREGLIWLPVPPGELRSTYLPL